MIRYRNDPFKASVLFKNSRLFFQIQLSKSALFGGIKRLKFFSPDDYYVSYLFCPNTAQFVIQSGNSTIAGRCINWFEQASERPKNSKTLTNSLRLYVICTKICQNCRL